MERNLVLKEFLDLRKSLNQGNKLANEMTQFKFEIEPTLKSEYRLMAVVFGQQDRNMIEVTRRDQFGNWERSGFTKYKKFENFCAEFLNKSELSEASSNKNTTLFNSNMLLRAEELLEVLDSLMIGYFP